MKQYRRRVSKIVDELINYFFYLHATDIQVRVQELSDQYKIYMKGDCPELTEAKAQHLIRLLNTPTHTEVEEYYWELIGESAIDSELALIGMMTSEVEVVYETGNTLEIVLYRAK